MGGPRPLAPTLISRCGRRSPGCAALQKLRQQIVRYQLNAESLDALLKMADEVRKAERDRLEKKRKKTH